MASPDNLYYADKSKWNSDSFVSLADIIDNILLLQEDDSYLKNTKRFRAVIYGKLAIKKLSIDVRPDDKAIGFTLAPSKIFPFPRYMTNWKRVSVLNKCGKLQPLEISDSIQVVDYLQDNDKELFFDCNGSVLKGDIYNAEVGDCCLKFECKETRPCGCEEEDFSESKAIVNKKAGYFEFTDDLVDRTIVIEFGTHGIDGLDDCDIKVHNEMELTVMSFIQYNLLKGKRNTPRSEWIDYYKTYLIEKRRSKNLLADPITLDQIKKAVSLRYLN